MNVPSREMNQTKSALGWPERMARITPSWAEQGMASARRSVESTRSRLVSSVRVTMVAMVSQAKPRTMGITARPLRPMRLNERSTRRARRGK